MRMSTIAFGILGAGVLAGGIHAVNAQKTFDLPQIVITPKRMEIITAPTGASTARLTGIKSSNPGVATAQLYRANQIQIVAIAPGKTTVEFFDAANRVIYKTLVWVEDANASSGGGAGYDPGKTQLNQIVLRQGHTENVTVPGTGRHQLSSVVSSNPSVAIARTNTANTIQVYAKALGDTWIDFRDNATGKMYQVHVWVTRTGALPPSLPATATTQASSTKGEPETELFNNFNSGGVINGPRSATEFTLSRPARITALITYHWNDGRGALPGTVSLRDKNGKIYGPFSASGSSGQGGAVNVDWTARTDLTLPADTYTILDSNPRTWSNNAESGFAGFAKVRGHFLPASAEPNRQPPRRTYVRSYQADDVARIWINERLFYTSKHYDEDSGWLEITGVLRSGKNTIRFELENGRQGYVYGFQIKDDETIVFDKSCGTRGHGCNNDDTRTGIVYRETIILER